ncbi:hypothetical protein FHS23_004611 [Prauserella isguenensis]|uniref:Uncharacterized protein n=1 Tax=Prauserella isguenensis TaxID=1470180 RepID=A0A839SAC2_9PSEU|nr:hypothetical protein [Prauserella isguenensis]MBB3053557.1 hypothetical protein [Prauserella isguenensis]
MWADPNVRAVLVLLAFAAAYVLYALIWPFTHCGACGGGKRTAPQSQGRYWRKCGRCGGTGKKIRLLARMFGRNP